MCYMLMKVTVKIEILRSNMHLVWEGEPPFYTLPPPWLYHYVTALISYQLKM